MNYKIGIDYSLSSPAITILPSNSSRFQDGKTYYVTTIRKYVGSFGDNIVGIEYPEWHHPIDRYVALATLIADKIPINSTINLEDYAFAAKGKIFHIAENTAILKFVLHNRGLEYKTIPPTVVKKQATGKGNSNKDAMYESFVEKTEIDLKKLFDNQKKIASPISDIVDSYFIALL